MKKHFQGKKNKFTNKEFHSSRHIALLLICTLISIISIVFSIKNFLIGDFLNGTINIIVFSSFAITGIYNYFNPEKIIQNYILIILTNLFSLYFFINGSLEYTGYLWGIIIPLSSLFFIGWKKGLILSILYLIVCISIVIYSLKTGIMPHLSNIQTLIRAMSLFIIILIVTTEYEISSQKNKKELVEEINKRKKSEFELSKSNERFALAVKGSNDGIWDWDLRNNSLFLSPRWKEMLGYADFELENIFSTFEDNLHPNDKKRVLEHANKYLNGEIDLYNIEFRMKHKTGDYIWILARGAAIKDAHGKPYRMAGSHTDITHKKLLEIQLRESEQLFKDVSEAAEECIWELNQETKFTYICDKIIRILGVPPEQVLGKTPFDFMYDDDKKLVQNAINECLRNNGKITDLEHRTVNVDGTIRWVTASGLPIFDSNMNPIGFRGTIRDITFKKQMELDLINAKEEADAANVAKSQFLANMSHEIRTPMNGIMGFLQLLEDTPLNSEQSEFIKNIKTSTETLLTVINDILDVSKIEACKIEVEKIIFDIHTTMESSITPFSSTALQKGLELNLLIRSDVPQFVLGDPTRLRQVITNLISNAIKFTGKGEILVKVELEKDYADYSELIFTIKDTGIGISTHDIEKLFKPFSQVDPSSTRKYGGTGLGLAISKSIIEIMGGEIKVESEVGVGSSFIFKLKFDKADNIYPSIISDYSILRGKRVLIVDDHAMNRDIARIYLEEQGCMVVEATNATDALSKLMKKDISAIYNMILLDYHMPDMNGYELAAALKEISTTKDIPLLLMTSMALLGDAKKTKSYGFAGYLSKPYKRNELLDCICMVLDNNVNNKKENLLVTRHMAAEANNSAKARVLIVEDNEINTKVLVQMLKRKNIICDIADNGEKALRALDKKDYDIVFMDCQMPVLDGFDTTKKIREMEGDKKHTVIIAMTAYAMVGDKEKCLEVGMDDYLEKPLNIERFTEILNKYIPSNDKNDIT